MRIPVLTYHAGNVAGGDYDNNDHVALAADLALFDRLGWRVVPLDWAVAQRRGDARRDLERCLVLTCDDGTDLDAVDVDFPGHGRQRSFLGCLQDACALRPGRQPHLHLSAFVLADPVARDCLDRHSLQGRGWLNQDWWRPAQASGLMAIECHSWDHNHPALPAPGPDGMARGDFLAVDNDTRAAFEIDQAVAYLNGVLQPAAVGYFAYPWGQANAFLSEDYLPRHGERLGLRAALGVAAEPLTADSPVWRLPRYVCGWHWKSPEQLQAILRDCEA